MSANIYTIFSFFKTEIYLQKMCQIKIKCLERILLSSKCYVQFFCMKKKSSYTSNTIMLQQFFLIYAIVPKICISTPICANYIYFLLKISNMSDIVTIFLHKMYIPIILYKIFCFKLNVFVNISYVSDACLYF